MKNPKFLYFDTETTDVDEKGMVQLAFIDDDELVFDMLFKPEQEMTAMSMSIHNITPEMIEDKPSFDEALIPESLKAKFPDLSTVRELIDHLSNEYIWIAHNTDFDLDVFERLGLHLPKTICTLKVARYYLKDGDKDIESYRLQFLRYFLELYKTENTEHMTAHDALSDVYFLRDLFQYLNNLEESTVEEMLDISSKPSIMRTMRFGKYRGETLKNVALRDRDYLGWVLTTITDNPDLTWNVKRVLDGDLS